MTTFYDDPAHQRALNERWWRENGRDTSMAPPKHESGPHEQSQAVVNKVLRRARAERGLPDPAPDVKPLLTVVEPTPMGATRLGAPTTSRNVSTVTRLMLIQGLSNQEIFEILKRDFGKTDKHKGYPAWYRSDLTRKGVLTGDLATSNTRESTMAAPMKVAIPLTVEEQIERSTAQIEANKAELKELQAKRAPLKAGNEAFVKAMGWTTPEQKAASPLLQQLANVEARMAMLQTDLENLQLTVRALKAAKMAQDEEMKPKAERPTIKVVAKPKKAETKRSHKKQPVIVSDLKDIGAAMNGNTPLDDGTAEL